MKKYFWLLCIMFFSSCTEYMTIVTNVHEKDANLIIVLLESKGISAKKEEVVVTGAAGGSAAHNFNIMVDVKNRIEAMAILNQNGLPRRYGDSLLQLFAGGGLISNDKEQAIRYEQGLASQITNTLLMIDGVLDISVQLSSPTGDSGESTAAIYVKHQGVLDDPNSHLESKIKRLVAASAQNLPIENVTVISDRARVSDIDPQTLLGKFPAEIGKEYVKVWSMIMSSDSVTTFRSIFFVLLALAILFFLLLFWMVWKIYPIIKEKGGMKELFTFAPYQMPKKPDEK